MLGEKVTYAQLLLAKEAERQALMNYKESFCNYLRTCLDEAGYVGKLVRAKSIDKIGVLKIEPEWNSAYPHKIKFYPVKKNGEISMKSMYVSIMMHRTEEIPKQLTELFEIVGDSLEG